MNDNFEDIMGIERSSKHREAKKSKHRFFGENECSIMHREYSIELEHFDPGMYDFLGYENWYNSGGSISELRENLFKYSNNEMRLILWKLIHEYAGEKLLGE